MGWGGGRGIFAIGQIGGLLGFRAYIWKIFRYSWQLRTNLLCNLEPTLIEFEFEVPFSSSSCSSPLKRIMFVTCSDDDAMKYPNLHRCHTCFTSKEQTCSEISIQPKQMSYFVAYYNKLFWSLSQNHVCCIWLSSIVCIGRKEFCSLSNWCLWLSSRGGGGSSHTYLIDDEWRSIPHQAQ
jgi:hypothetical protein